MSAILSADDLNDFISPGVACIKPVETLRLQKPEENSNPYEVTTEDKLPLEKPPPAQISLTDCLACSGCVTSAEAVLVSLQSHSEVINILDSQPSLDLSFLRSPSPEGGPDEHGSHRVGVESEAKVFIASISPQVRASLAATYNVSEREAGWMIDHLLGGPEGLASGGKYRNGFSWIVDTNAMREVSLVLGADEVMESLQNAEALVPLSEQGAATTKPKKPILSSACPGWICYAEKTHPHVLPHLSRLKSPQALTGTLLKTLLSKRLGISPAQIWHVAVMPCFDKKLEASREELTDIYWRPPSLSTHPATPPVRDVDCVITARELLMLADTRGISFPALPRHPLLLSARVPFPDRIISAFLFPNAEHRSRSTGAQQNPAAGTSGGYLYHILATQQALHPNSTLRATRGRNADVIEYTVERDDATLFKAARYYGFRNIQNLVRKLKPVRKSRMPGSRGSTGARPAMQPSSAGSGGLDYAYVEVMACPGGCTNGGGQIKAEDVPTLASKSLGPGPGPGQKEWLAKVDEAYFSMEEDDDDPGSEDPLINNNSPPAIRTLLQHWADVVDIPLDRLLRTGYRAVVSEVGKRSGVGGGEVDRVVEIAGRVGGGW